LAPCSADVKTVALANIALDIPARLRLFILAIFVCSLSFFLSFFVFFFLFCSVFYLTYHTLTARLATFIDDITARPRRPTRLHPHLRQSLFVQHTDPSVTPKTVRYNLVIHDSISDISHVYKLTQKTREEQRSCRIPLSLSFLSFCAISQLFSLIAGHLTVQSVSPRRHVDLRSPLPLFSSLSPRCLCSFRLSH